MKTRKKKLNGEQRALLAAYVNAQLQGLDGFVPRRLRLDYETMSVVQLVPVTDSKSAGIIDVMDAVKPMLRELRRKA